jgi:hypothetical protein
MHTPPRCELGEDAPGRPHVNRCVVIHASHQDIRRPGRVALFYNKCRAKAVGSWHRLVHKIWFYNAWRVVEKAMVLRTSGGLVVLHELNLHARETLGWDMASGLEARQPSVQLQYIPVPQSNDLVGERLDRHACCPR